MIRITQEHINQRKKEGRPPSYWVLLDKATIEYGDGYRIVDDTGKYWRAMVASAMKNKSSDNLQKSKSQVGTYLSKYFKRMGFKYTPTCGCENKAREMNIRGADWCEKNIDTILDWLKDEAKNRGVPFVRFVAKRLIQMAIKKDRKDNGKEN